LLARAAGAREQPGKVLPRGQESRRARHRQPVCRLRVVEPPTGGEEDAPVVLRFGELRELISGAEPFGERRFGRADLRARYLVQIEAPTNGRAIT